MDESKIKSVVEDLINTFLMAGEVSINLRYEGLNKEIKSDNTPVSNGDLEVNKIVTKKLLELTPDIPIVSEETSHNKSKNNFKHEHLHIIIFIDSFYFNFRFCFK